MHTNRLVNCLNQLAQLPKMLFDFSSYEIKKIVKCNNAYLKQWTSAKRNRYDAQALLWLDKIMELHDIMHQLHLLRYREPSADIFLICQPDLQKIGQQMANLFTQLAKSVQHRQPIDTQPLRAAIQNFEWAYQKVLQAVVEDQTIFLFFIKNCHAFVGCVDEFFGG